MSLVTYGGKLLLSPGGHLTLGPAAAECCCGAMTCESLPDTLELVLMYCGEAWIFPLTFLQEGGGVKVWETDCRAWLDCRGAVVCPELTSQENGITCFVFACDSNGYYLQYGLGTEGCYTCGTLVNVGMVQHFTEDPFECVWDDTPLPLLDNVCCQDPHCEEIPVVTVRIPA